MNEQDVADKEYLSVIIVFIGEPLCTADLPKIPTLWVCSSSA
jgi:hypothetical protein